MSFHPIFAPFENLWVVGYATSLNLDMLPTVVPPVFHDPKASLYLVPPYTLDDQGVHGGTWVCEAEFWSFCEDRKCTALGQRFAAHPGKELWIDAKVRIHYRFAVEATRSLAKIAKGRIAQAEQALSLGNFTQALWHSIVASNADDRLPQPFAIRAALHQFSGDKDRAAVCRDILKGMMADAEIDSMVAEYVHRAGRTSRMAAAKAPRTKRVAIPFRNDDVPKFLAALDRFEKKSEEAARSR